MSADGNHLVFGSTSQFEEDGNDETGDVSIYERDLVTGDTQVVSTTPAGTNLPCLQGAGACHSPGDGDGIAELAISRDGSRVVVAQRVSTDAARQPLLASLPARRIVRSDDRSRAGDDQRRPLRRDDGRRLEGLLHHPRPARRR